LGRIHAHKLEVVFFSFATEQRFSFLKNRCNIKCFELKLILGESEVFGFDMIAIAVAIGVIVFGIWIKLLRVFGDATECFGSCCSAVP